MSSRRSESSWPGENALAAAHATRASDSYPAPAGFLQPGPDTHPTANKHGMRHHMQFERSSTEPRLPDDAHRAFSHRRSSFTGAFVVLTVLVILSLLGLGVGMASWNA